MAHHQPLKDTERLRLLDALHQRYAKEQTWGQRALYYRKKYAWIVVVRLAKFLKRFFNILFSCLLLLVLFPAMLIIALIIKIQDGGSALYITNRVGKWGKEFRFPKFRTMSIGADKSKCNLADQNVHKENRVTFKIVKDPRITRFGKFLRKTSLDELPQLWNVLKGEMSLVGPRPPLPEEVAKYTLAERRRLDITPGITGIWQVSGRADIPFDKQVELDMEYIESQSLWLDVILLLKTIPAVLFGRGAY